MNKLLSDYFFYYEYTHADRPFSTVQREFSVRIFLYFVLSRSGLFVLLLRLFQAAPTIQFRKILFWFFNLLWSCDIGSEAIFGKGLYFPHPTGIVIGNGAVLAGKIITFNDVTLGKKYPGMNGGMPYVGKNTLLGVGARLLGDISLDQNVLVAANTIVTRDVPSFHTVKGINSITSGVYWIND
jgi:serine O-acetyltransferase